MSVGSEIAYKAGEIFNSLLLSLRVIGDGIEIDSNGEGLDEKELLALFEQGRLEVRIRHSKTVVSRMKVIAPNIATARGYSGWVLMDEIGFVRNFKELYEAVEPIISSDHTFRLYMATTPPNDDAHYSFELAQPPPGITFIPCAVGHRYISEAGVPVHRLDAWDADLAGVKLYDKITGKPVSPEEHRSGALDRDAWDRNYGLKWMTGGTSAIALSDLASAQEKGAQKTCIAAEGELPKEWWMCVPPVEWALGYDVATTEGKTSNPSAIVITAKLSPHEFVEYLVYRYKTASDLEAIAILHTLIKEAALAFGRAPRRIAIDATNERYFANSAKRELQKYAPIELVIASETVTEAGQKMTKKSYLGNLYCRAYEDGRIAIPPDRWVKDDRRLVKRVRGSFENELDSAGNHADTFDAGKLAFYALTKSAGITNAQAVSTTRQQGRSIYG